MREEKGFALISVLWILVILSLIATELIHKVKVEQELVETTMSLIKAESVASSGIKKAVTILGKDDNGFDSYDEVWASEIKGNENGISYSVKIKDDGSKICINTMAPDIVCRLPGLEKCNDILADWRDADEETRPNGAESSYYLSLPYQYASRNGWMSAKEEVKMLKGFTSSYEDYKDFITVDGMVNPNITSIEAFDSFLLNCGIEKFRSQRITNELLRYRKESGTFFGGNDEFVTSLHELTKSDFERIKPFLSWDPPININTAPNEVILAICENLGLPNSKIQQIAERRNQSIKSKDELQALFPDGETYQWFSQYFGVCTSYFWITSSAVDSEQGVKSVTEALLYKHRDTESDSWKIDTIYQRLM